MRENFYAELSRRLREEGIESSYAGTQNLNVLLHGQPVLCVTPSSEIFILPAGSKNEEVNDLYHRVGATADEVYEYVEAVQSSPLLRASDLKRSLYYVSTTKGANNYEYVPLTGRLRMCCACWPRTRKWPGVSICYLGLGF